MHSRDPSYLTVRVLAVIFALIVVNQIIVVRASFSNNTTTNCDKNLSRLGFELWTGRVYSAAHAILTTRPGTLRLDRCLLACIQRQECRAVNFETGLCVLLSESALDNPDALTVSQYPVFTMYAHKVCYSAPHQCNSAWTFDLTPERRLTQLHSTQVKIATNRLHCQLLCLKQTEFVCRSASFERATFTCRMSSVDRHSLSGDSPHTALTLRQFDAVFMENNCWRRPQRLCVFHPLPGRLLKTVDHVFQHVRSASQCRQLCVGNVSGDKRMTDDFDGSGFLCRSYDYNDTGRHVCRISHHSQHSLVDLDAPYLLAPRHAATTHELHACYDVAVSCHSSSMSLQVHTDRLFSGRVYSRTQTRGHDNNADQDCGVTVTSPRREVSITLSYNVTTGCGVRRSIEDDPYNESQHQRQEQDREEKRMSRKIVYSADVVLQQHARVRTQNDVALSLRCSYSSVSRTVVSGDGGEQGGGSVMLTDDSLSVTSHSSAVLSPNISMLLWDSTRQTLLRVADMGQPVTLHVFISDPHSPYTLHVHSLMAAAGGGHQRVSNNSLPLLDSGGCSLKTDIASDVRRLNRTAVAVDFSAFRFPVSDVLKLTVTVAPCVHLCPAAAVPCSRQHLRERRARRSSAHQAPLSDDPTTMLNVSSMLVVLDRGSHVQQQQRGRDGVRNLEQSPTSEWFLDTLDQEAMMQVEMENQRWWTAEKKKQIAESEWNQRSFINEQPDLDEQRWSWNSSDGEFTSENSALSSELDDHDMTTASSPGSYKFFSQNSEDVVSLLSSSSVVEKNCASTATLLVLCVIFLLAESMMVWAAWRLCRTKLARTNVWK